jgi:hypothetical protein
MNREIAGRSMWVWSPRGEGAKFKTTKFSSKAVASNSVKFYPTKISRCTVSVHMELNNNTRLETHKHASENHINISIIPCTTDHSSCPGSYGQVQRSLQTFTIYQQASRLVTRETKKKNLTFDEFLPNAQ